MTRRTEAPSASLFGWVDPGAVGAPMVDLPVPDPWSVPDELGTAPMFGVAVERTPARHAAEAPADRCDWPEASEDDDPTECGRAAFAVYHAPGGAAYPRCRRHDTVAAQRRAAADGWIRRTVQEGSEDD
jgi:hypothetical protein